MRRTQKSLRVETLESRRLLAAEAFHNFLNPLDVNDDQLVSPVDALSIINHINRTVDQSLETGLQIRDRFLDVNDDMRVTPIDALRVINHLNRDAAAAVDRVFAQLRSNEGGRMRAEFVRDAVGDLIRDRFEVRLQNGIPGREYPVFFDGGLVGQVTADPVGRGVLEIVSDVVDQVPLLEDIAARVNGTVGGGLVHIDGLGGVMLAGEGEGDNGQGGHGSGEGDTIRIPDFGMLPRLQDITGPVYATALRQDGDLAGAAYYSGVEEGFALGLVARGFEADQTYDVAIDGVTILNVTAGRYGVVSILYDSTDADAEPLVNPLPEVLDGSVITVGAGTMLVSGTFDGLEIPFLNRPGNRPPAGDGSGLIDRLERTLVAPLDGDRVDGLVTYTPRGDGYYLGIALRGAERRESYNVLIDGVTVATVRANFLGLVIFRQTGDDAAADGFPVVTEDSVVEIEGLATGEFITAEEGVRDLLGW